MNRKLRRFLEKKTPNATSNIPDIKYDVIMTHALEEVVRTILKEIEKNQNESYINQPIHKNDNSIHIRVRIDRDDVIIPEGYKKHAKENNIRLFDFILDRWFKNLKVYDSYFEVEVLFDNVIWDKIIIPYSALVSIKNEASHFALNLEPYFDNDNKEVNNV